MVRVLLTRRWLTALVVAALFAVACYHLGVWQYGRYETKAERNAQLDSHFQATPVPIDTVLGGTTPLRPDQDWTRVTITGSYATNAQLIVRNRVRGSATGYEVLAPFRLTAGRVLVVDRGWVPLSNRGAATPPDLPPVPTGTVTIIGWLRPSEGSDGRRMPAGQLATLDLALADAQWGGSPVAGAYLNLQTERLADGSQGGPRPLPLDPPDRDLGPNQAYAYQWWLFMVAGFGVVFLGIRREWRETDPSYVPRPKKVRIWDEEDE